MEQIAYDDGYEKGHYDGWKSGYDACYEKARRGRMRTKIMAIGLGALVAFGGVTVVVGGALIITEVLKQS